MFTLTGASQHPKSIVMVICRPFKKILRFAVGLSRLSYPLLDPQSALERTISVVVVVNYYKSIFSLITHIAEGDYRFSERRCLQLCAEFE